MSLIMKSAKNRARAAAARQTAIRSFPYKLSSPLGVTNERKNKKRNEKGRKSATRLYRGFTRDWIDALTDPHSYWLLQKCTFSGNPVFFLFKACASLLHSRDLATNDDEIDSASPPKKKHVQFGKTFGLFYTTPTHYFCTRGRRGFFDSAVNLF